MSKTILQGHSPTLDTLMDIENVIKKKGYFKSKTELFRSMHNKVQYNTLIRALNYLEQSNKIESNNDGSIIWIFLDKKNKAMAKTLKKSISLR